MRSIQIIVIIILVSIIKMRKFNQFDNTKEKNKNIGINVVCYLFLSLIYYDQFIYLFKKSKVIKVFKF